MVGVYHLSISSAQRYSYGGFYMVRILVLLHHRLLRILHRRTARRQGLSAQSALEKIIGRLEYHRRTIAGIL